MAEDLENRMGTRFDRESLLAAFDEIGAAAVAAGTKLEIAVFGGSALMLASNFRFASEDVDAVALAEPWPAWLGRIITVIAARHGWSSDWFNDAVTGHLSSLAERSRDYFEFGSFPRDGRPCGLNVYVPKADYMLALKLKAMRVNDPVKGPDETRDIVNLLRALKVPSIDAAINVLRRYFPKSAEDGAKQRFLLKHIWQADGGVDAPAYPVRSD